jgi:hypothetical protein
VLAVMLVLTKSDLLLSWMVLVHQHNGVWWRFIVQSDWDGYSESFGDDEGRRAQGGCAAYRLVV